MFFLKIRRPSRIVTTHKSLVVHGQQVRQIHRFDIDSKSHSGNFDDTPELVCSKAFPNLIRRVYIAYSAISGLAHLHR